MSSSIASKARFPRSRLARFKAMKRNDKTTRAIFIFDTPSLLEIRTSQCTSRDIEAHKSAHASIRIRICERVRSIARRLRFGMSQARTPVASRRDPSNRIEYETGIGRAGLSSVELGAAASMRLVLCELETSG